MKNKLSVLILLSLFAIHVFAIDPWGTPEVLPGSMVLESSVYINGFPASVGDVVAAFVSVDKVIQLRGKASVVLSSAGPGCFLQVYTLTNGETISFQAWDESEQSICDIGLTWPSVVNGIVGAFPNNLVPLHAGQSAVPDPWPSPQILSESMTITATISIDSLLTTEDDILAAFVTENGNEVLRGKGQIIVDNGVPGCILQVFTETNGETITLKVWDYSAQQVYTAAETLPSQVNGSVGSWPDNLYPVNATGGYHQVAIPFFSPEPGSFGSPVQIYIGCLTMGARVHYTTDGSDPSEVSELFISPILCPLFSDMVIKARAFYPQYEPSMIAIGVFNTVVGTDDPEAAPICTGIESIYPNPFGTQTSIRLSLKEAHTEYTLKIYNIRGELVYQTAGIGKGNVEHTFNGCDMNGNKLASGIYILSFQSGRTRQTRKMVIAR